MELILEGSEGCPAGGILSIKVGEMKRQAPLTRVGQPFRFPTSPAELLPLKVDLLMPAAESQTLPMNPAKEIFEVDFGNGLKVKLRQREARELQRPTVDIASMAEAKGLEKEKVELAQSAAEYLEKHDLVRLFQDILHGLLVLKPSDPLGYVEQRLLRNRQLPSGASIGPRMGRDNSLCEASDSSSLCGEQRRRRRSKLATQTKIESLLTSLQSAHENLVMIMPFLPDELRDTLTSNELKQECENHFRALDTKGLKKLTPEDLLPLLVQLTTAKYGRVNDEQCKRFAQIFDANEDGYIQEMEFITLVQFVVITAFLESDEGKQTLEMAKMEEQTYNDFIGMIEEDKERLWAIIPFLPEWLVESVTSEQFMNSCTEQFMSLDKDGSGNLEPEELLPVIELLCQAHPLSIDQEKCKRFVKIFDQHQNGVIMQDEFVEFAQFLAVMNFLTQTAQGQQIREQTGILDNAPKLARIENELKNDERALESMLPKLPTMLVDAITAPSFASTCEASFDVFDTANTGYCITEKLYHIVSQLSAGYPFSVDADTARIYFGYFDQSGSGIITKQKFVRFAKYCIVLSFVAFQRDNEEMMMQEVLMGKEKVDLLLASIKQNIDRLDDIIPTLPDGLKQDLLGQGFTDRCMADFATLDEDGSGNLEEAELVPLLMLLSEAHQLSLTEKHAKDFLGMFDSERNGVITKAEYVNLARFMLIMSYVNTEAGLTSSAFPLQNAEGSDASVEEFLKMIEQDRQVVAKVVPLLPSHVFNYITSDEFVLRCYERFQALDQDRTGVLKPWELITVVAELTRSDRFVVTEEHCKRFTKIFDIYGDGVLRPDEFLEFARFLAIVSFLYSEEGKYLAEDAAKVFDDSKKIEDLLEIMSQNRKNIQYVLPYLPDGFCNALLSSEFQMRCMESFRQLDADGNGTLEPQELYPLIIELAAANKLSIDLDVAKRFTSIFDDAGDGVIRKEEFVNFCRFQMIMAYLAAADSSVDVDSSQALAICNDVANQEITDALRGTSPDHSPRRNYKNLDTEHLAVDADFYQRKSEKLSRENEVLRVRTLELETLCRRLESKMEEQEQRLRHCEVDLRKN
eukprot:TRINITY_DN29447_c0_g1_i1.p1 TRINITY_DN29447_c0_g1~~TRINITY_DN29447_c0_g1_i1.p1  ORF type:complete len:1085 (-),score=358.65 TRINITY_DN29447_c0_g1_i1:301-3555(-)